MARLRAVEASDDFDLDTPPPMWQARWVYLLRIGSEHMGGPAYRAQNWRQVFAAGDVDTALDRVRGWWADKPLDVRRRWWQDDPARTEGTARPPAPGTEECPHHLQAVAYCEQNCPTVARAQRAHDADHAHYWLTLPPTNP